LLVSKNQYRIEKAQKLDFIYILRHEDAWRFNESGKFYEFFGKDPALRAYLL